jgi:hypothetical protein
MFYLLALFFFLSSFSSLLLTFFFSSFHYSLPVITLIFNKHAFNGREAEESCLEFYMFWFNGMKILGIRIHISAR